MKAVMKGLGAKSTYWLDGAQVTKEVFDEANRQVRAALPQVSSVDRSEGNRPWSKAILSDALAVHPEQIPEVMERNRKHGLEIEYNTEDGRPVLLSRDQRRRLMKIEGVHDRDGGYGDG